MKQEVAKDSISLILRYLPDNFEKKKLDQCLEGIENKYVEELYTYHNLKYGVIKTNDIESAERIFLTLKA